MAPVQRNPILSMPITRDVWGGPNYNQGIIRYDSTNTGGYVHNTTTTDLNIPLGSSFTTTSMSNNVGGTNALYCSNIDYVHDGLATMDWMQPELSIEPIKKNLTRSVAKKSKTIETGRVEEGSKSDQKFKTVNKDFEYFAFHTVEYKLLPVSQKINTSEDLNVRRYCTNCGAKQHKDHKFCGHCGTKA
jgi:rRNA maturation endonuclease Nob1